MPSKLLLLKHSRRLKNKISQRKIRLKKILRKVLNSKKRHKDSLSLWRKKLKIIKRLESNLIKLKLNKKKTQRLQLMNIKKNHLRIQKLLQ